MDSKIDRYLMRTLKRGKKARLGIMEKVSLSLKGRRDGIFGFPKEDAERGWTSPSIQREINSCNEAHNRICGILQIRLGEKYRKADSLAAQLVYCRAKTEELLERMPADLTNGQAGERRKGEERLTEQQVNNRRAREHEKRTQKYLLQKDQAEKEEEAAYRELIELKGYIVQKNYEAELACERIRNHVQQRIDYYWNAASHAAGKNERSIPPVFKQLEIPDALERYKAFCGEREQKMEDAISRYDERKEAA